MGRVITIIQSYPGGLNDTMLTYDPQMSWEDEDLTLVRTMDLIDLDLLFANTPEAKIINNENLISPNLSKEFTDQIFENSDGELGFSPSCKCGFIYGTARNKLTCPKCGTICSTGFTDVLTHRTWLGIPQRMPPVLHPIWYLILKNWTALGRKNESILDAILNPEAVVPDDFVPYLRDEPRGFQYFYDHADEILDILTTKYARTAKKPLAQWIPLFSQKYRYLLFTRHLPILHSSLHPLTKNGSTMNYIDSTSKELLEAIINLSAETFRQHATNVNQRQRAKTLYDIYVKMIAYYSSLVKEKLGGKQALLRKHCYGSRVHHSFRSVVVPQTTPQPMDIVQLPWCTIVNGLKPVILNFLSNRFHKSDNEATQIFFNALVRYDDLVDRCMRMYIDECPNHKGAIILGRNPTLTYGSIYLLYYNDFKRDPRDETISINACIVKAPNIADNKKDIPIKLNSTHEELELLTFGKDHMAAAM